MLLLVIESRAAVRRDGQGQPFWSKQLSADVMAITVHDVALA